MCVDSGAWVCVCKRVCMYVYMCVWIRVYMSACLSFCVYVFVRKCVSVLVSVCMSLCVYAFVYLLHMCVFLGLWWKRVCWWHIPVCTYRDQNSAGLWGSSVILWFNTLRESIHWTGSFAFSNSWLTRNSENLPVCTYHFLPSHSQAYLGAMPSLLLSGEYSNSCFVNWASAHALTHLISCWGELEERDWKKEEGRKQARKQGSKEKGREKN